MLGPDSTQNMDHSQVSVSRSQPHGPTAAPLASRPSLSTTQHACSDAASSARSQSRPVELPPSSYQRQWDAGRRQPSYNSHHPLRSNPPPPPSSSDITSQDSIFEDVALEPSPALAQLPNSTSYHPTPSAAGSDGNITPSRLEANNITSRETTAPHASHHLRSQSSFSVTSKRLSTQAGSLFNGYKLPLSLSRSRTTIHSEKSDSSSETKTRNPKLFKVDWFGGTTGSAPINIGFAPSPTKKRSVQADQNQDASASETGSDFNSDSEAESESESDSESLADGEEQQARQVVAPHPRHSMFAMSAHRRRTSSSLSNTTSNPSPTSNKTLAWLTGKSNTVPDSPTPVRNAAPLSSDRCASPTSSNTEALINLSIPSALYPHGPADPLDPSSLHELHTASLALCTRLQAALASSHRTLREAQAEAAAREDELDEAETRATLLRSQLEALGRKVEESEHAAERARMELREERAARAKSLRIVSGKEAGPPPAFIDGNEAEDEDADADVEDDGESRTHRKSASSAPSDSGFESDSERASPPRTPRQSYSATTATTPATAPSTARPKPLSRTSTFDRVVRGMPLHNLSHSQSQSQSQSPNQSQSPHHNVLRKQQRAADDARGGAGCCRCSGGSEGSAWTRVSALREEKRVLGARVDELEGTVRDCLDVVRGLGLA